MLVLITVLACGPTTPPEPTPTTDEPIAPTEEPIPAIPGPTMLEAARTADGVALYAESAVEQNAESGVVDFGSLPAGRYMENMRFMSPLYRTVLLVENNRAEPLSIEALEIGEAETEQPSNPFTACGVEFVPYELAPGDRLEVYVCFHPERPGPSSGSARIRGEGEEILAEVGLVGRGRKLEPGEAVPMGLIPPEGHFHDMGDEGNVELRDGQLIETTSGDDVTPTHDRNEPPEDATRGCEVSITGGGEIPNPAVMAQHPGTTAINTGNLGFDQGVAGDEINVGQHVILDVAIACPDGARPRPTAVVWTLPGAPIRDYEEAIRTGTVTTTALTEADLRTTPRDLYWTATGTHRVEAQVDYTWNGQPQRTTATRDVVVERNAADIDRQMEDFYLWNHEAKVLKAHYAWHPANPSNACSSTGGADFYEFHRLMLGSANGFRTTFGYGPISYWDGTQALPVSPDSLHANRAPGGIPFPTPSYYTFTGGPLVSACKRAKTLHDFSTAADLADEMEAEWHGRGHVRVGGEMSAYNSPKDPIFFRWHRAVDIIYDNWLRRASHPTASNP